MKYNLKRRKKKNHEEKPVEQVRRLSMSNPELHTVQANATTENEFNIPEEYLNQE